MSEDAAGAFTIQVISMLLLFFMLGLFIFGIQNIQTIDFKNYVDGQLERHGGLTEQAAANIDDYSKKYYEGRYSVTSMSGTEKLPYGEPINYKIKGTIQVYFLDLPNQITFKEGSTISLVR